MFIGRGDTPHLLFTRRAPVRSIRSPSDLSRKGSRDPPRKHETDLTCPIHRWEGPVSGGRWLRNSRETTPMTHLKRLRCPLDDYVEGLVGVRYWRARIYLSNTCTTTRQTLQSVRNRNYPPNISKVDSFCSYRKFRPYLFRYSTRWRWSRTRLECSHFRSRPRLSHTPTLPSSHPFTLRLKSSRSLRF